MKYFKIVFKNKVIAQIRADWVETTPKKVLFYVGNDIVAMFDKEYVGYLKYYKES